MLRIIALLATVAIAMGVSTANAATSSKSPGEISAASLLMAEKQEGCRIEAKRQELRFLKRRHFMRTCMKSKP